MRVGQNISASMYIKCFFLALIPRTFSLHVYLFPRKRAKLSHPGVWVSKWHIHFRNTYPIPLIEKGAKNGRGRWQDFTQMRVSSRLIFFSKTPCKSLAKTDFLITRSIPVLNDKIPFNRTRWMRWKRFYQ